MSDENPKQCPVCEGPMENWKSKPDFPWWLTDQWLDGDALNSAVDVMRMKQSQPHHSMQTILWEAIKDYAERACERAYPPSP